MDERTRREVEQILFERSQTSISGNRSRHTYLTYRYVDSMQFILDDNKKLENKNTAVEEENRRLKNALYEYADNKNWEYDKEKNAYYFIKKQGESGYETANSALNYRGKKMTNRMQKTNRFIKLAKYARKNKATLMRTGQSKMPYQIVFDGGVDINCKNLDQVQEELDKLIGNKESENA